MYAPAIPGKILELQDRIFRITECYVDDEGELERLAVKCLNPREGDKSPYWAIEVVNEHLLKVFTIH